ncbi:O-antigen ligase family protein [Microvirga pudoricolor]|uniref:O-antigen ligase family protein n=1 Tax=Microvirga pudoricolor TaxID=2778729 RepID=UPI00194DD894|nr:O-antigen ligase family protein [Microvirga pudoricolor]MBM6594627.1 O-antigen ligase family protein [Microvirga pudoricolor]
MSTLSESTSKPLAGARVTDALWRASMIILGVMPVGMTVAHRSSPLFLGLGAAFAVAALWSEGRLGETLRRANTSLRSPLGLAVGALLAWSLLSVSWSEVRELSLAAVGEFWLPVAFAFALCLALPRRLTVQAFWLLVVSVCLSQLLMLMDLRSDLVLRKALGMRGDSYIFNRTSLTLLVVLPAIAAWFTGRVRPGRILAFALFAVVSLAIVNSDSGAGVLGLVVGTLTLALAWVAPGLTSTLVRVAFVGMLALAPVFGPLSDALISDGVHKSFSRNHSRARVDIWHSFDAAIRVQPVLGAGFGASPLLRETSVTAKVPEENRVLLGVGHPHNAPIQVWVELGAVGAFLVGLIGLLAMRRIDGLPREIRALSLALVMAILSVGMVGHGAWQGWWAAAIGASIVWMRAAGTRPQETEL